MSNVIKQRIKELAPLYGSSSFATWHLRAILDILLRSVLEDFRFVGDLGLSETDRVRVDDTLNGLAGYYSGRSLTKQARSLPDRFSSIHSSYHSWLRFLWSDRLLSRWHLDHMNYLCKMLNKSVRRSQCIQTLFNDEEVTEQLDFLLHLADAAPGTFYHLAHATQELGTLVRSGPLHKHAISERPLARIITASAPIWRVLQRDIQTIYQLSPPLFEEFIAERLERMGLHIRQTGSTFTSDGGVDLIAWPKEGPFPFLLAVQVKHHSDQHRKVGPTPIKDMQTVVHTLPFHAGLIVTNTGFTPDAEWWASKSPGKIQLHDIESIRTWISGHSVSHTLHRFPETIQLTSRLSIDLQ